MPRWVLVGLAVGLVLAAVFGFVWQGFHSKNLETNPTAQGSGKATSELAEVDPGESTEPTPPETEPPPGLPIIPWGKRDHFRAITSPRFVSATSGDTLLAPDENVLGLVVDNDIRAYSTNQLNEYEMVLDVVGGIPVLVTY